MNINFKNTTSNSKCLVLFVDNDCKLIGKLATSQDNSCMQKLSAIINDNHLTRTNGSHCFAHQLDGTTYKSIMLFAITEPPQTNQQQVQLLNKLATRIVASNIDSVDIDVNAIKSLSFSSDKLAKQLALALSESSYKFQQFKTKDKTTVVQTLTFIAENINETDIQQGAIIGNAINSCKDLGNMPANICTPAYLADFAKNITKNNAKCQLDVLEAEQMQELGMDSLLSVSKGSVLPPKLIVIKYNGAGAQQQQPYCLVGKGVTFDTGGISLKPSAKMDEMKYDMCGAASVLAATQAAIELELKINLVTIVAAVENMPSDRASKPGDIVKSMDGKTIEILNTDAEGRLILCDALTYAQQNYNPTQIVDVATLTGACVIALGHHLSGLYSNNQQLCEQLLAAGKASGDRAWQMPLGAEYTAQLSSQFADLANIGGIAAGSVTAASFLKEFCENQHWAHLDIAGTAWVSGANKGSTGRPVALLVEYLQQKQG